MMLVLSRKHRETVFIGNARVEVLSTGRRRIKLGIDAPATVLVRRGELPAIGEGSDLSADVPVENLIEVARRALAWMPQPSSIHSELRAALEPFAGKAVTA